MPHLKPPRSGVDQQAFVVVGYAVLMGLTMSERAAVTKAKALAYVRSNRVKKTAILVELVELTGWHREMDGLKLKVVKDRVPSGADVWAEEHRRVGHVLGGPAGSGR